MGKRSSSVLAVRGYTAEKVAVLHTDWHRERPLASVRMQAKSRPSLRMVEKVVLTMAVSTSSMMAMRRCHRTSRSMASKLAVSSASEGHRVRIPLKRETRGENERDPIRGGLA